MSHPADPSGHFEALFHEDADPWGYRTRWYERRKRNLTLASLPRLRYTRAFEPACAAGELSAALAERCDRLLASDGSAAAVARARRRLTEWPQVTVEQASMPAQWPTGTFDLIVVSEFGYYLEDEALDAVAEHCAIGLDPGGTVLACHWRQREGDYLRLGDAVHRRLDERLSARDGMTRLVHHEEADFLIDVWSNDPRSVAQCEGIRP